MSDIKFNHDGERLELYANIPLGALPILVSLLEDIIYPIAREHAPAMLNEAEQMMALKRELLAQLKSDRPE